MKECEWESVRECRGCGRMLVVDCERTRENVKENEKIWVLNMREYEYSVWENMRECEKMWEWKSMRECEWENIKELSEKEFVWENVTEGLSESVSERM